MSENEKGRTELRFCDVLGKDLTQSFVSTGWTKL